MFGQALRKLSDLWNRRSVVLAVTISLLATGCGTVTSAGNVPTPAVPIDPAAAILSALGSHDVVVLDEGDHGLEQGHAFRMALLRDRRLPGRVNDIVVEFGSARYQAVLNRFIDGETVPLESLRHVWQDTTQPHDIWDGPIYEEFFRTVRKVNGSLPPTKRLRVWLGDPPIEWESVHSRADQAKWFEQRDTFPAALIEREILNKGRKALVLYGSMHLVRQLIGINYGQSDEPWNRTITRELERRGRKVFTIWTNSFTDMAAIQQGVQDWPTPRLALLRGSQLGAADFTAYYPFQTERGEIRDGHYVPISRNDWRQLPMEQQFDAVLHLGQLSTLTRSRIGREQCADPEYLAMRTERMRRTEMPPEMDALTPHCREIMAPTRSERSVHLQVDP